MRAAVSRLIRRSVLRRAAFLLEAVERRSSGAVPLPAPDASVPVDVPDCRVLAVVAHWRTAGGGEAAPADPLRTCLLGLLGLGVEQLEIVLETNDEQGAAGAVAAILDGSGAPPVPIRVGSWTAPSTEARSIVIERWRPRGLRRHGFHLTWDHKRIFRAAEAAGHFTHLLYLEDDIGFTRENLRYWLTARRPLHERGLIPGFVRSEHVEGRRVLTDQARPGQHRDGGEVDVPGSGRVGLRVSRRPYQALVLLDAPLARYHLHRSSMRSPLRSRVVDWAVRERACAGEMFAPTEAPFRAFLRAGSAPRPRSRHGVLVQLSTEGRVALLPGAVVEHLRPTASSAPGNVPLEDF